MFETELLHSFVAVAVHGGFTNAAKLPNSTEPTASAHWRFPVLHLQPVVAEGRVGL